MECAAGYAGQGPLGSVDGPLLRRLEGWARRGGPVRARLDATTLRALLALAPLYGAYVQSKGESEALPFLPAPPPDHASAELEQKVRAALARLEEGK